MTEFSIRKGDVVTTSSDLLLIKHAQSFYGADADVATRLISAKLCTKEDLQLLPGDSFVLKTDGVIGPIRVLFLGTEPLSDFKYDEMQTFAYRAIEKIVGLGFSIRTLTTTIHGTGYGLDGGEALQRLIFGFQEGLSDHNTVKIDNIVFLTIREREERILQATLLALGEKRGRKSERHGIFANMRSSETSRADKKRVFVAMPFAEDFYNVYEYGIYPAVRNCGFICERIDETHFAGDIRKRIKDGIQAADYIIADITGANPNVYLEVGFAWGVGVPVIFIARKGEKPQFDVGSHKCVFYGRYGHFAKELEELLRGIEYDQYR